VRQVLHTKRSHHGYGQTPNHGDKVRRPRKEGQTGFNHIEPSKARTGRKRAKHGPIGQFVGLPQQTTAEASKKGGSRTRRGEVGTGSTLPKDMMEMTERGAPGPNATSTRRIFMLPVSTEAHSGSGGGGSSPVTSITPIDFLKPI